MVDTAKWLLALVVASILVIPAAWVQAAIAGWVCRSLRFSDGGTATFRGTGGDIVVWQTMIGLIAWVMVLIVRGDDQQGTDVPVLIVLGVAIVAVMHTIFRWLIYNVHLDHGPTLIFTGGLGAVVGWHLAILAAGVTVIGWAWVAVAMYRWLAKHIKGQGVAIEFRGSAIDFLWRTTAVVVGSALLITIPFLAHWYAKWFLGSFVLIRGVETSFAELIAERKPPSPTSPAGPPVFGPIN
ncbi:MAG: hypothetical protein RL328_1094 [Acidobacteriota bacterium]